MADDSKGVLGHLPPLPRAALNNSVVGMEQAYRKRKGLPPISDADVEALKAGIPMSWEEGGSGVVAAPSAVGPVPAAPVASAAPVATAAPAASGGTISEEVAKWVAEGKQWSSAPSGDEHARHKKKNLPPLSAAEAPALRGDPVESPASATPALAATPAPVAAAAPSGPISDEVKKWTAEGKKW